MAERALMLHIDSASNDPDADLLRRVAQGEAAALHELYARHGLALLNFLIAQLEERPLAEEVLQDVMLIVWRQAGSFRGESRVLTWIYSIARRQAARARSRQPLTHTPIDDLQEIIPADDTESDYTDLIDAIDQLPADQQQALDLIFYRGYSGAEAAQHLDISENTLKSRLFRARRTLRGLLAGRFGSKQP